MCLSVPRPGYYDHLQLPELQLATKLFVGVAYKVAVVAARTTIASAACRCLYSSWSARLNVAATADRCANIKWNYVRMTRAGQNAKSARYPQARRL